MKYKNQKLIFTLIILGIIIRFSLMLCGHNFDFESYCIVGKLASAFKNVYANTTRYNYGFIFFCIQGLFYKLSFGNEIVYRILIVSLLTLADLGIACIIADKKSWIYGLIFFLNPISLIITGLHNQFDNIAILLALVTTYFYNEGKDLNKNDWLFVLFMSLSLITKHVLFIMPWFLLVRKKLPFKKRIIYSCLPPTIFLLSFIPFAIGNHDALMGIFNNVFLNRSFNNSPLLYYFYEITNFPSDLKFIVYIFLMCVTGLIIKNNDYNTCFNIYLISMVSFASAIANQYLVIPMAGLCLLDTKGFKWFYMITMSVFLAVNPSGLNLIEPIQLYAPSIIANCFYSYSQGGYVIAAWILFLTLIYLIHQQTAGISMPNNRHSKNR